MTVANAASCYTSNAPRTGEYDLVSAAREQIIAELYNAIAPPTPVIMYGNSMSTLTAATMSPATGALVNAVSQYVKCAQINGTHLSTPARPIFNVEQDSIWSDSSSPSKTETFATLVSEARPIIDALRQRRGELSQERFMFDVVAPFVKRYGTPALQRLDEAVTAESLPYTARYYYSYLLGHIRDEATVAARISYLHKYAASNIDALREGAEEAFGHLSAA